MKITEIYIKNYLQFKDFTLNLTYPDTGQPLEKVCFIGPNGTGKTTLLNIINNLIVNFQEIFHQSRNSLIANKLKGLAKRDIVEIYNSDAHDFLQNSLWTFFSEFQQNSLIYLCIKKDLENAYILLTSKGNFCFSEIILSNENWKKLSKNKFDVQELNSSQWLDLHNRLNYNVIKEFQFKNNDKDLISYVKSDADIIDNNDLPKSDISQALMLFKDFPFYHDVSSYNAREFWKVLIYTIKTRENRYIEFLNSRDVEEKSVKEAKKEFDEKYPKILEEIADHWNLILEKPGLEFDVEKAKIPIQLNDNLEAYIKFRKTNKIIPYNRLSTGIRNFIFQIGYIYTLYFIRDIQHGFLLIDEPEASLFPDLLYDIIDLYLEAIQNTQFFVATHSPIIAGQFDSAERIILEFDDNGYVEARSGVSPEGDDPNDLLMNDFVVRSLYGKKGVEKWKRYLELQRLIPETEDKDQKKELLKEYSSIGNAYNFLPHEISE